MSFTEQAGQVRDRLDDRRRAALGKGIAVLAQDPFLDVSGAVSAAGDDRTVRLTQSIPVEYTVGPDRLPIFVVEVLDDEDIVITDAEV
ncbi:hypothetical protein [Streptomyces sp. MUM 203J]|uniref:hypothetical protein n=1 Tax=Streptomyces sp. MUM 203J TaxID=2791990 RepID=UPI001F03ED2D|nr:hypothetical protein [Streptomyces sp. MUM 203J]